MNAWIHASKVAAIATAPAITVTALATAPDVDTAPANPMGEPSSSTLCKGNEMAIVAISTTTNVNAPTLATDSSKKAGTASKKVVSSLVKNKVSLMLSFINIMNPYILIWIHVMRICYEFIYLIWYVNS